MTEPSKEAWELAKAEAPFMTAFELALAIDSLCASRIKAAVEEERERCARIADALSKLYERHEIGFDAGYRMGTTRVAKEIRAPSSHPGGEEE